MLQGERGDDKTKSDWHARSSAGDRYNEGVNIDIQKKLLGRLFSHASAPVFRARLQDLIRNEAEKRSRLPSPREKLRES